MSEAVSDRRRAALLGQLRYLLDEAEALGPLLARLPEDILTAALPGERSPLATFAHLAALDREVYAPQLRGEEAPEEPESTPADDLDAALADLHAARTDLVAAFEAKGAWPASWYDLALTVVHRDAEELKRLAYRMHESHITTRAVDLPK